MTRQNPETISEAQAATDRQSKSRIAFPLAGDGAFFLFTLKGLVALEEAANQIRPDWQHSGFSSFGITERLLLDGNATMIRAAMDAGLKRLDDSGRPVPMSELDLDEVSWPLGEIVEPALQAICYSHTGKTYTELIAEMTDALQKTGGARS